ncbi:MAG: TRAP transporter large permease subunit [Rhodospirillaceae bacterium]|nr:TRAP transporter large permease subunit [Rhodospirillaceae bacterium]
MSDQTATISATDVEFAGGLPHTRISTVLDPIVRKIGEWVSWLWVVLVCVIVVNVVLRYVFGEGRVELEEIQWHFYSVGFLFGLSYCFVFDGHVRVDIFHAHFPPRLRAWIEFFGLILFLGPFIGIIIVYAIPFVERAYDIGEISDAPGGLPYRWLVKAVLPASFAVLGLAAVSYFTRVTAYLFRFPESIRLAGAPELGTLGGLVAFLALAGLIALECVLIWLAAFDSYLGYAAYLAAAMVAVFLYSQGGARPIPFRHGDREGWRLSPAAIVMVLLIVYTAFGIGRAAVHAGLYELVSDGILYVLSYIFVELSTGLATVIPVNYNEMLAIFMFALFLMLLFTGYPIAWLIGGIAVVFTAITVTSDTHLLDTVTAHFPDYWDGELSWRNASLVVSGTWDQMRNSVLVALPMFIFMGLMLDRSGIAEKLMDNFVQLFGGIRGGYAVTITLIGVLLAASTGIIGASVVLLTLLGLPVMLKNHYNKELAVGTVAAVGTLGILIPPSIMLVLMADRLAMSVGDLFMGAMFPGLLLGGLYIAYILILSFVNPHIAPAPKDRSPITLKLVVNVFLAVLPPAALILAVLGTIFFGVATPTEASGVGAAGATLLAVVNRRLTLRTLVDVARETTKTTAFIFAIVVGAVAFALVLRFLGGDELIERALLGLDLGALGTIMVILGVVFLLGFVLDWIQIILIVLTLVQPIVVRLAPDLGFESTDMALIWFTVLFAVVLQTSFLTPPVGFALFYVKGVAPPEITVRHIYAGVVPYILLQLLGVALIFLFPGIVTYLPRLAYGTG